MSTEIVTDICPPPQWDLTAADIQKMVEALAETYQNYRPAFERSDQAAHGWVYLKGLLSDLPRKVTERIALRFGVNVRSLQHFIGQSPWSGFMLVAGFTCPISCVSGPCPVMTGVWSIGGEVYLYDWLASKFAARGLTVGGMWLAIIIYQYNQPGLVPRLTNSFVWPVVTSSNWMVG